MGSRDDASDAPIDNSLVQLDVWGAIDSSGHGLKADTTAIVNTLRALFQSGHLAEAEKAAENARRRVPDAPDIGRMKFELALLRGDPDQAIAGFDQPLALEQAEAFRQRHGRSSEQRCQILLHAGYAIGRVRLTQQDQQNLGQVGLARHRAQIVVHRHRP